LSNAVVTLLSERSGAAVAQVATATPVAAEPSATIESEPTEIAPTPTAVPENTATPTPSSEPTEAESTPSAAGETTATPEPTPVQASSRQAAAPTATPVPSTPVPALTQMEDTNPGPPFTIEISSNTAIQDPLVEASQQYRIMGLVRNDSDQYYAVSAIHATFYDADGFRGIFTPAIRDGKLVGGEWDWHAEPDAEFAALLLAPGEVWPFSIKLTAQNMASFLIHPDAAPTGRESTAVDLSNTKIVQTGTDFVRVTGTATNNSIYKVKNVTVAGTLLNANGQIVSVGSTYVLQQDIEPGASVDFDLRIEKAAFASYQLYAQAERDWE
jgi:hypothetical protein